MGEELTELGKLRLRVAMLTGEKQQAERERDAVTASLKVVIDAAEHTTFWPSAPKDPLHLAISEARRLLESLSSAGSGTAGETSNLHAGGTGADSSGNPKSRANPVAAPKAEDNPFPPFVAWGNSEHCPSCGKAFKQADPGHLLDCILSRKKDTPPREEPALKGPVCRLCGSPIHRVDEGRSRRHLPPTEKTKWAHVGSLGQRHRAVLSATSAPEPTTPGPQMDGRRAAPIGTLVAKPEPEKGNSGADDLAQRSWEEDR